jgi:peroxiredoxin
MKLTTMLLSVAIVAGLAVAPAANAETKKAPAFNLVDANGKSHSLADYKGDWVVLEWVNFDCPFVKKQYSGGAMQARQEFFRDEGVKWLSIASSAPGKQGNFEGSALTARLEKEKWSGDAYLIDAAGKVGKAYGAKTTPHMFVIDPQGNIAYEGAIDALRSANAADIFVATNYVVESIEAAKAERPIPNPRTKPYGCSVKY